MGFKIKGTKEFWIFIILILFSFITLASTQGQNNNTFISATPINETPPHKLTVMYEQNILDVFNNKLQRPGFDNNTHARVIVYLKDNSNITVTGTKEERRNLSRHVNEWFEPVVKGLLATLSEDEFRIIGKPMSRGFAGYLTMKGFDKLIADKRVSEIHLDFLLQLSLNNSASLINVRSDVWNLGYTGDGVKICVIDSGVNKSHPALSGKISGEICYCSPSDPLLGTDNCCPNGFNDDDNATDYFGHGTYMAGIIASQDSTYKGIAYDADVWENASLTASQITAQVSGFINATDT